MTGVPMPSADVLNTEVRDMAPRPRFPRLATLAVVAAGVLVAAPGRAPAQTPTQPQTSVTVSGGSQGASQRLPAGGTQFGLRVPLKPNAENVLTVDVVDDAGRAARVENVRVAQLSLTEIVKARVTAQRLSTPEIKQLVADGTINVADPANYNVSRFVVALVVGGREVQVPVPVVRQKVEPIGVGEPISIGCSASGELKTTDRAIAVPCGGGGGGAESKIPDTEIIPFEIAVPELGFDVSIPGVILIDGRIKTLKEFFRVNLLLMNVSPLFTLTDLTARIELPEGALSNVAPAGGTIALPDIAPETDRTGEFIIRGDQKGIHTLVAHFGGKITGSFLSEPVPFSGSAATDLEVKGPPKMAVKVEHPDYVTANVPYDLVVQITNTDPELDALYTTLAIDVGGGADLVDETTGLATPGATIRSLGDILKGDTIIQRYRVLPKLSGPITSCVGAATENLSLTMDFVGQGHDPGCAVGTLPSEKASPDGRPTVTVVPAHNTTGVRVDPAITAIFSAPMIEQAISTGFTGANFRVVDPDGFVVDGTLLFTTLFDNTAGIFRPTAPLKYGKTYTIVVDENIFDLEGRRLASGVIARFTTEEAPFVADTDRPTITLALEAPLVATSIQRGQRPVVIANSTDNEQVVRVDLLLDGELIDTRRPNSPVRFVVDTSALEPGSTHVLSATALDAAGNVGSTAMQIQIAGDSLAPLVTLSAPSTVGRGRLLPLEVTATDDGAVARVQVFFDQETAAAAEMLVAPYRFALDTSVLSIGQHVVRAVATDGAGNAGSMQASLEVTGDTVAPVLSLLAPQPGSRVRSGAALSFAADATDNVGLQKIEYFLDGETSPRGTGASGVTLDTKGLAVGPHVMTIRATDSSGNLANLLVPFDVFVAPADTDAPAAPTVSLITFGTPTAGILGIVGAAGSVEANARVVVLNLATQAGAVAFANAAGEFSAQIEAAGGQTLAFTAIDDAGNQSAAATKTVPVAATLTSISVSPVSIVLNRQATSAHIVVLGQFSDATQRALRSDEVAFSSSARTVADVTTAGLVIPGQNGSATISVTAGLLAPVPVPVTVNFASVTGVTAGPNPLVIAGLGQARTIEVRSQFSDGTSAPFSGVVRFATGNPDVIVVDGEGRVTSVGVGSTSVTVAAQGYAPQPVLVVVQAVQATELVVSPGRLDLTDLGQTRALAAAYRYSDGTTGTLSSGVTYRSLDSSVVDVSASGLATATGEGTTEIVVQASTFVVSVPVSVTVPTTLPAPVITALGRPVAGDEDTLVVLGQNFAGTPALNFVTINGQRADVIGAALDRVIVRVPRGATSGPVQVRVGGQDSNTLPVSIYPRLARVVLTSTPFNATPAPGQTVDLGSATVVVHPGDAVVLAGDPNTIVGQAWSGLVGPSFAGTLVVTVAGVEHTVSPSAQPVDLQPWLPPLPGPAEVTIGMRVEALSSSLSARAFAIVAGPPGTGAFAGQRTLPGDGVPQQLVVRFRVNAPDGTLFAATANTYYTPGGGYPNGSAGGAIVGGVGTPNDGNFRNLPVQDGEVAVVYSDAGLVAAFGTPVKAVVSLVPTDASGNRQLYPVSSADVLISALDSASVIPQPPSIVADTVDRQIPVEINSVRDNYGNAIRDGSKLALTASAWYERDTGAYPNGSAGGAMVGGIPTPNDGRFRTYTLAGGVAQASYTASGVALVNNATGTAILAACVASAGNDLATTRPFAEGRVSLSAPSATDAVIDVLPNTLSATAGDNRSIVTLSNLTDASGRLLPDGTRIAVTAQPWYRFDTGSYPNETVGGTIVGGAPSPNDGRFRSFVVNGGAVSFTYSSVGLALDLQETATAVLAIMPANGDGSILGSRPFAEARITLAGVTTATIVATPSSTLADGTRRPVAVAVTNIRDALGHVVPDGTRIALTASPWYRRSDGQYNNGSAGGVFIDGVSTPNDGRFRTYTVTAGRVDATFSAESVPPLGSLDVRSSVIAAVVASPTDNGYIKYRPFAEGTVAVSSVATATAVVGPSHLLADRQDRRSTLTVSGLVDAQGRAVPDGTNVAVTAVPWYRLSDGNYHNDSAGGTMLGGMGTPNHGGFRTYTVQGGSLTATYSNAGLFVDVGGSTTAVLSLLPADANGNYIGSRPFAAVGVALDGMDTGTFLAPATMTPGETATITLTNIRDTSGTLVPDGTKVGLTAAAWYNRDGTYSNQSAGGTFTDGAGMPNDGQFRVYTVTGGQITATFVSPGTPNVTSVISAVPADGEGNRPGYKPFVATAIRTVTGVAQ